MRIVDTLRDEHSGVLNVLEQLDRAVAAAEHGVEVPPAVFTDIQEFFAVFVDRCHHGKEELVLFPALSTADAPLRQRLEQEHARGRQLAQAYVIAATAYTPSDLYTVHELGTAARAYAAFLRAHIALETDELFPLVERSLSDAADALAVEEFERIEQERIGPGTHERLHAMIGGLGPRLDRALVAAGRS